METSVSEERSIASHIVVIEEGIGRGRLSTVGRRRDQEQEGGEVMVTSAAYSSPAATSDRGREGVCVPFCLAAAYCNMVLLLLGSSFVCISTWAWIDAYRQVWSKCVVWLWLRTKGCLVMVCGIPEPFGGIQRETTCVSFAEHVDDMFISP